jgi:hypothetical protein
MSTTGSSRRDFTNSAWAVGGSIFAAATMFVGGLFQFFEGLVALINGGDFFVRTPNYVFRFDATAWGWIHLIIGVAVAACGLAIFTGNIVARSVGILIAVLALISNFLFLPYYPLWSIVLIALNILVIWSLSTTRLDDR